MIQNFKHRSLKHFFERGDSKGLPSQYVNKIRMILAVLNGTTDITKVSLTGLHPLTGDRKGYWSLTVSRNWRITFRFQEGDVFDVDYEDYH